jgi:TolA-binding protein
MPWPQMPWSQMPWSQMPWPQMPWPQMQWPWIRRACLMAALLAVPITAHAQIESREGIALQNQLYKLQQDMQILRSEVERGGGGGGGGGGDIAAQLLSRVQAMEEQMRQLRGRIDETQNLMTRQNAELSKRIDDLTFQLNLQQGRAGTTPPPLASAQLPGPPPVREVAPKPASPSEPARQDPTPKVTLPVPPLPSVIPPSRSPPPQSFTFNQIPEPMRENPAPPARVDPPRVDPVRPVPPPAPPKPAAPLANADQNPPPEPVAAEIPPGGKRTPELALQEGHAALARRDYAAAEKAAREVMANRASPRAYDGQFLLAQALSAEKQFAQAAIAYDDAYNRSHKGRHAQDALIGLAVALTAINEKKAACDTLGRMRTEFPEVRADLRDTITRTNERAGCAR